MAGIRDIFTQSARKSLFGEDTASRGKVATEPQPDAGKAYLSGGADAGNEPNGGRHDGLNTGSR